MSSIPRVSILMPLRNEQRYLPAALESLTRQTLTEWELIAVDDGSTDATPSILEATRKIDSRVRVIRQEGGGLVSALNIGLAACRSPLVARMDGDDICHRRRLELQVAHLDENPEVGLVACAFRHFPRTCLKQGMLAYETWQNSLHCHDLIMRDLFVESPFVHPSVIVRKTLLERVNGFRDCGWPEDYDLWMRLAAAGTSFARLPESLFFWRDHPDRATRVMDAYATSAFRACKLHHLQLGYLKNTQDVVIAGAGLEGRAWQRILAAAGIRVSKWIDVDQRKIGKVLHDAPVVSTEQLPDLHSKILVAIGVRCAREQFRELVLPMGLKEGLDFICVA